MYNNLVTSVPVGDNETDRFPIRIGLHQGSVFIPYIFALVMDEVMKVIHGYIPWCMLFYDDVVPVNEIRVSVNR